MSKCQWENAPQGYCQAYNCPWLIWCRNCHRMREYEPIFQLRKCKGSNQGYEDGK